MTVAADFVAPDVLTRFDIVGFDPRGIGASDPLQCFATDAEAEAEALLARMTGVPLTKVQIRDTLAANYEYTEACKRNAGPLLHHMSTLNVAKDLDLLRAAVGDSKLNYVGRSYGTLIGATYVNLFPQKVRAVVIDGNVDPEQRTDHRLANKFDRAGGFEIALAGFLSECDKAGPACAFSGDARRKFDRLRAPALLTSTSTPPARSSTFAPSSATPAAVDRSPVTKVAGRSVPGRVRAVPKTSAPASANRRTAAAPSPLLAPVISTRSPVSPSSLMPFSPGKVNSTPELSGA